MKRIFNWEHSKNKKYAGRIDPTNGFDEWIKYCVWWNETQYCLDLPTEKIK